MAKITNHLFTNDKKRRRWARARIVSSSAKLISTKPISDIKVEDVAAHSEMSRASFYKCFRSVEDFLNVSAKQAGAELLKPVNSVSSTISDIALRTATKTRVGIRLMTSLPSLGRFMLKTEWPFGDVRHKGYKDIQNDIRAGIEQGYFTDMPVEIGVNLVISAVRIAVQDGLNSKHTEGYETEIVYTLLLSLGVDSKRADKISKIPFDQLPDLPKNGLVGKIVSLVS